ncbi:MAG TPA: VOC family protein [Edaphobacter sp.]
MAQPFVHLELNTPDLTKAKDFYAKLFGWTFNDVDMGAHGTYSLFKPDSGPGGGMMSIPDAPKTWLAYVNVDEISAATNKAKSLGATVVVDSQPVPGQGVFSVIHDPTGVAIALWQAKTA